MNLQTVEKRIERTDGYLEVHSIFRTIQGEGPFAGTPATFVRLAGCNLQCPGCDTEYTQGRRLLHPSEILHEIGAVGGLRKKVPWVGYPVKDLIVITGGEPFRQRLGPFIAPLLNHGFTVQIETNGTLYDDSLDSLEAPVESISRLVIVCSPKTPSLHPKIKDLVDHLKYIVEADKVAEDGLPTESLGMAGVKPCRPWPRFVGNIYVQPMDPGPDHGYPTIQAGMNQNQAIESCMNHGYVLCLQTHKIIGLP